MFAQGVDWYPFSNENPGSMPVVSNTDVTTRTTPTPPTTTQTTPTPTITPSPADVLEPTDTITPTPTPTATPEPTATPTQAPTSTPTLSPTNTTIPALAPDLAPTAVASDVPGTPLAVGGEVSSIVDVNTKPRDVYAIELAAGQEVVFTLSGPSEEIYVQLANPDTESFDDTALTYAFYQDLPVDLGWRHTFLPAVSGTYYLSVAARHSSQPYTVSVAIN
jgi:hypothetical protein